MTPKEVLALIRQHEVTTVDFRFMDFPGVWQHFAIPADTLTEETFEEFEARMKAEEGAAGSTNTTPALEARDEDEAMAFVNDYAPEHFQVLSREPFQYLGRIEHAGELLLGEYTPTTLGNYVLGPSHVLPTSGWARTASPVSVFDFMKRTSVAHVTSRGYPELAKHAHKLATYEGFEAHANAVSGWRDKLVKR